MTPSKTPCVVIKNHALRVGRLHVQVTRGQLSKIAKERFMAYSRAEETVSGRLLQQEDLQRYVEGLRDAGVEVVVDAVLPKPKPVTPTLSAPIPKPVHRHVTEQALLREEEGRARREAHKNAMTFLVGPGKGIF